jgi:hypothetical protein
VVVLLLLAADCGLGIGTGPRACPSTTLTSVKCCRTPGQQTPLSWGNQVLTSRYVLGERKSAVSRWCGYREREVGWQGRKLLRELNFFSSQILREKIRFTTAPSFRFGSAWASSSTSHSAIALRPTHPSSIVTPLRVSFVDTNQLLMNVAPGGLGGLGSWGEVTCCFT